MRAGRTGGFYQAIATGLDKKAGLDAELLAYGLLKMKEVGLVGGGDAAKLGIGATTDEREHLLRRDARAGASADALGRHRAEAAGGLSIAYFFDLDHLASIEPLPGCVGADRLARYAPVAAGKPLIEMYRRTTVAG